MSYCRWSCMNGACMVYAYEDCYGGWTIHLAGRKRKNQDKMPPNPFEALDGSAESVTEYLKRYKVQKEWMESPEGDEWTTLSLPHAGDSYQLGSLQEFKDKLIYLREVGYLFPDYVFDAIDEEMKDDGEV